MIWFLFFQKRRQIRPHTITAKANESSISAQSAYINIINAFSSIKPVMRSWYEAFAANFCVSVYVSVSVMWALGTLHDCRILSLHLKETKLKRVFVFV